MGAVAAAGSVLLGVSTRRVPGKANERRCNAARIALLATSLLLLLDNCDDVLLSFDVGRSQEVEEAAVGLALLLLLEGESTCGECAQRRGTADDSGDERHGEREGICKEYRASLRLDDWIYDYRYLAQAVMGRIPNPIQKPENPNIRTNLLRGSSLSFQVRICEIGSEMMKRSDAIIVEGSAVETPMAWVGDGDVSEHSEPATTTNVTGMRNTFITINDHDADSADVASSKTCENFFLYAFGGILCFAFVIFLFSLFVPYL